MAMHVCIVTFFNKSFYIVFDSATWFCCSTSGINRMIKNIKFEYFKVASYISSNSLNFTLKILSIDKL